MITQTGKCTDNACPLRTIEGYCQVTACLKQFNSSYSMLHTESAFGEPYYVVSEKDLDNSIRESLKKFLQDNYFLEIVYHNVCRGVHEELVHKRHQ